MVMPSCLVGTSSVSGPVGAGKGVASVHLDWQQATALRPGVPRWRAGRLRPSSERTAEAERSTRTTSCWGPQVTVLEVKPVCSPRRTKVLQVSVFISYRASDSAWAVLLDKELSHQFGSDRVFQASRSIPPSADFSDPNPRVVGRHGL